MDERSHDAFMKEVFKFGEQWKPWLYLPPRGQRAVEVWRYGWEFPETLILAQLHPTFNVSGIYWREIP